MAKFGRRPIIQGLDIMTQLLARLTNVIGVGFSVQFRNPISGGDSIRATIREDGTILAEGPEGDILSREAAARLIRTPEPIETLAHYPYHFSLREGLGGFRRVFGLPLNRDRLAYLLAIGAHSGALVHRFSHFDDPCYADEDASINAYFAKMKVEQTLPLFLDIEVQPTGEAVHPGDTLEFATRFDGNLGESRYGRVSVYCRTGDRNLFRTRVQFMMLPQRLINRRYSKPLSQSIHAGLPA